jgi:hypothetical protein
MKFEEKNYMRSINRGSPLRKLEHDKRKLVCNFYFKHFHYGDETSNDGFVSARKNIKTMWYKKLLIIRLENTCTLSFT